MDDANHHADAGKATCESLTGRRTTFRPNTGAGFPPTRWSLVVMAADASEDKRREALRQLCEHYHDAIYAFIRREWKRDSPVALDLTNGFVSMLLKVARRITFIPQQGKSGKPVGFRSYVCRAVKHYVNAQLRRSDREKTSETDEQFEQQCVRFLELDAPPDPIFDQVWAESVMRRVLRKLQTGPGAMEPELFALWVKHGNAKLPDGEFDKLAEKLWKPRAKESDLMSIWMNYVKHGRDTISEAEFNSLTDTWKRFSGSLRVRYWRLKNEWNALALRELIALVRDTLPNASSKAIMDEVNAIRQILKQSRESFLQSSD